MRLGEEFFHRDCLVAAPELVGKVLVRSFGDGRQERLRILETEAYRERRTPPATPTRGGQSGRRFCTGSTGGFTFIFATGSTGC